MKKSKLISITLALTLVLTTVFVGAESVFAGTVSKGTSSVSEITASKAVTFSSTPILQYTAELTAGTGDKTIIPVKVSSAGTLAIPLYGTAVDQEITVSLHSDPAGENLVGFVPRLNNMRTKDIHYVKLPKAGTYYLKFEPAFNQPGRPVVKQTVKFSCILYPDNGTMTNGSVTLGSVKEGSTVAYYKIVSGKTQKLTISMPYTNGSQSKFQVKLTNSSKKSLTNYKTLYHNNKFKTTFSVKKGTYYIAVKPDSNQSNPYFGIKPSFSGSTISAGTTKSTAKTISKGNTKRGMFSKSQGEMKRSDYYKFTLKKSQKVTFDLSTITVMNSYSGIKLTIYKGSTSKGSKTFNYNTDGSYSKTLPAGTYYLKVSPIDNGDGFYQINWK